ncbi:MAG: hypothetical protein ACTHN5_03260 [Phycisphaerae bacterium]
MTDSVATAGDRVEGDAPCRQCGYNLRGLEVIGKCPECGAAVENSIHGDLLQYSSGPWLEKVRLGFTLVLWGILVQVVGIVVAAAVFRGNSLLVQITAFAAGMVSLAGMWLVTEPDPGEAFGAVRKETKARRVVRMALVVSVVLAAMEIGSSPAVLGAWAFTVSQVLSMAGQVAGLVSELAQLTYIARLAERVPHWELARMARGLRTAYAILMGTLVLISATMWLFLAAAGAAGMAVGCVMVAAGIGLLVVAVLQIVLLVRMRRQMTRQVELAGMRVQAAEARLQAPPVGGIPPALGDAPPANG